MGLVFEWRNSSLRGRGYMGEKNGNRMLIISVGFLLTIATLLFPIHLPAQGSYPVRPRLPTTDSPGGFPNVQLAYDPNTATASTAAQQVRCAEYCTTPVTFTTTWSGFPRGYDAPYTLVVRWSASATLILFSGATGRVEAKLEYSLDGGGSWSDLEAPWIRTTSGNLLAHDTTPLSLPSNQDTAQVQVRATLTIQMTSCPSCTSGISYAYGGESIWDIRIEASGCQVPSGETTEGLGWDVALPTVQDYRQTLASQGVNFYSRKITEQDPGGGGPDTCWWSLSIYDPEESITGGSWYVQADNTWGPDMVGWLEPWITYYRDEDRTPCSTQFYQRMVIDCGTNTVTYRTNLLRMGFDQVKVWSERDGVYAERNYP